MGWRPQFETIFEESIETMYEHSNLDSPMEDSADETSSSNTVVLSNLPSDYTEDMLWDVLDAEGFAGRCNYAVLSLYEMSSVSCMYANVQFVTADDADVARTHFEGFSDW